MQFVVNNSRFLILPWVKVKNLASKVLALCINQLPQDWQDICRYEPVLLETFVEKERFPGTCYKAANWCLIGETRGRGKLDRKNEYALTGQGHLHLSTQQKLSGRSNPAGLIPASVVMRTAIANAQAACTA